MTDNPKGATTAEPRWEICAHCGHDMKNPCSRRNVPNEVRNCHWNQEYTRVLGTGMVNNRPTPAAAAETTPSLLSEAALWLHAAYDRPPQTPEMKAMLARIDAALLAAAEIVPLTDERQAFEASESVRLYVGDFSRDRDNDYANAVAAFAWHIWQARAAIAIQAAPASKDLDVSLRAGLSVPAGASTAIPDAAGSGLSDQSTTEN